MSVKGVRNEEAETIKLSITDLHAAA
jgi:hypothetical protein